MSLPLFQRDDRSQGVCQHPLENWLSFALKLIQECCASHRVCILNSQGSDYAFPGILLVRPVAVRSIEGLGRRAFIAETHRRFLRCVGRRERLAEAECLRAWSLCSKVFE